MIAFSVNEVTSRVGENIQTMLMTQGGKDNLNLKVISQINLQRTFLQWCKMLVDIDLHRSERVGKTGVGGTLLKEAKYINLSLHFLEQVWHL